ncbi:MAG: Flp family type IVb pilin [Pseudorhodoplanes sp.]|mgnify:CR=1 FL=1
MDTRMLQGRTFRRFVRDERAGTAIEYAIIAAGVATVIVTAVNTLGETVLGLFEKVQAAFSN